MNGLAAFARNLQTAQSNPSVIIDLPDEGQETILDFEWPPFGTILHMSRPIYPPHLLTQDIALSDPMLYLSAVTEDKYNVPRQISFREARAIASSVMEEAEQRKKEAAEQEARFFHYLFDGIGDEEI